MYKPVKQVNLKLLELLYNIFLLAGASVEPERMEEVNITTQETSTSSTEVSLPPSKTVTEHDPSHSIQSLNAPPTIRLHLPEPEAQPKFAPTLGDLKAELNLPNSSQYQISSSATFTNSSNQNTLDSSTNLPVPSIDHLFINPAEVLCISSKGNVYREDSLGLCIDIPEGAVPEGSLLHLEIGMCLYGPFKFCGDLLAPILMLHPKNVVKLSKQIIVTIPHIVEDATDSDVEAFGIQVIKADHNTETSECIFDSIGECDLCFHPLGGHKCATFSLPHFCFISLQATHGLKELARRKAYCVCPLLPPIQTGPFTYHLCLTYFMKPFLKVGKCLLLTCIYDQWYCQAIGLVCSCL